MERLRSTIIMNRGRSRKSRSWKSGGRKSGPRSWPGEAHRAKGRRPRSVRDTSSPAFTVIAAIAIAAAITVMAGAVGMGLKGLKRGQQMGTGNIAASALASQKKTGGQVLAESKEAQSLSTAKAQIFKDFRAGFVNLDGLTAAEAKKHFRNAYEWDLKVSFGEERVAVPDLLEQWAEQTAEKISDGALPASGSLEPDYASIENELTAFAREMADRFNKSPEDSQVESYDKKTGVYTYTQETTGRVLEQEALVSALLEKVKTGDLKAAVLPEFTETMPARTRAQAKEQYQVIGSFTTRTTDNKNRNQNIRLAVEAIDGVILKPGQEFSFNSATGNRTSEKGYQPAGAYKNGVLIEEPGGGVCQVSTTLYHAIIKAGYRTTERNAHSFAPAYVEEGQDAMVSFDGYAGPDLKFVNTGNAAVALRASFDGRNLKMSIVGLPILDGGVTVSIRSEKVKEEEGLAPVYEENPSIPFLTERTIEQGKKGSVWKSYRIFTSKNGEVLKKEPLHNSYYKAKAAVIQKNTQFPPLPILEEPSAAQEESNHDPGVLSGEIENSQTPGEALEEMNPLQQDISSSESALSTGPAG